MPAFYVCPAKGRDAMKLCLISVDAASGCDFEALMALPHFRALAERGVHCKQVQTVYPTLTYPIHASLLTGCFPARHGIGHNQPLQQEKRKEMRTWYWEIGQIREKTLHEAAWEKGLTVASILWPVTGKNRFTRWNFPEIMPLPGENAALKMIRYGTAPWILRMELLHGKTRASIRQPDLDAYAALLCEQLYRQRKAPDVLTVHLVDLDAMRHEYGTDSQEAHAAMLRLDAHLGRIMDAIDRANLREEMLFCVVSDHGHRDAETGILLDQALYACCGARAQSLGMGAYIHAEDVEDAKKALEENKKKWRIGRILTDSDLRALQAPTEIHLAVEAEDGCCYIDEEAPTHGEHGFSVDCPQAQVLFMLAGPGIKENVPLPAMHLCDIAPTLAYALGLSLPAAQGCIHKEIYA